MKSLREENIKKNIESCLKISKEEKTIVIYSKPIKSYEFLINIIFQKDYFKQNKIKIEADLYFILHIAHNYPKNAPKLFCLTSLSHIGIELCDGKDILEDVIESEWDGKLSAKKIILIIPKFIEKCLKNRNNKLFLGKFRLEYEYDYNLLLKIPHHFFNPVEQIINKKTGKIEKRFLMITNSFFLVFSYKSGYFNYSEFKLLFWASIYSIYVIKKDEPTFEFEFSKNENQRFNIYLNINEGDDLLDLLLYIFHSRGVDYSVQGNEDRKKLPIIYADDKDNNIENINNNENKNENIKITK